MTMQRGLYVVLGAMAGYALFGTFAALGFAAVAVNLFTPLPAAFVGMRFGSVSGIATVSLTGLLILLVSGQFPTLIYLIQFGIPGAALPWLLNRGVAWDKAAVAALWGMVLVSIGVLLVASAVAGQSPAKLAGDVIDREIAQTTKVMQELFAGADLPASQKEDVAVAVENMAEFLSRAYGGVAIAVAGLMNVGLIFMLSVFARGRYVIPGRAYQEWKSPEPLVWVLIAAGFLLVFSKGLPETIALNLLVILLPVYFLQGLAVIDCFLRRKAFSPIIRGIGYVLVTLVNPLPMLVTGIGVFDLWADFRKPRELES